MNNYLMLLLAALLLSADNAMRKRFQLTAGNSLRAGLRFNMVLGGSAAVLFWVINGLQISITAFSGAIALLQAALAVAYTIIGFSIIKESVSLYALFLMTGSMILPYLWGICFLNESMTNAHLAGFALILCAVLITNAVSFRTNARLLLLCIFVFVLNGSASILTKRHQIEQVYAVVPSMDFVVLVNLAKLIVSAAVYPFAPGQRHSGEHYIGIKSFLPVILCTLVSGSAYLLQLTAAGSVRSTVMFPMFTGGSILFTALAAWLFFNEKPTRRTLLCILMCILGTCLFL